MNMKLVLTLVIAALMIVTMWLLLPTATHGQTPPGFIITNADATTYMTTTLTMPIPNVPPRFIVKYANDMRFYGFTYPAGMISDTIPPQITGTVTCNTVSTDTAMISWMTDEFAGGAVLYGTQAGVYTQTVSDPHYFKLHAITLTGLTIGTPYHYEVRNVDRSGNIFLSSEYICKITPPPIDLQVIKFDSPDPVRLGSTLTYTLVVTNNDSTAATGVILIDKLPASVIVVSVSPTQGSCNGTDTITCSLGGLSASTSATVTIVVTPMVGGTIINTASVSSDMPDPDMANNTDVENTTVIAADLSVTKRDSPDPVLVGSPLTYTIAVLNNGPSPVSGVVLTDVLPVEVLFTSATPPCLQAGGTVTCVLGSIVNGASKPVVIVVTPMTIGAITNTVSTASNEPDPDMANNTTAQSTIVLPSADLSVTKTDSPDPVRMGSLLTYLIAVRNNGPSNATGVVLTDMLPSGTIFNSVAPNQGNYHGTSTVICDLGQVNANLSAAVTIIVTPTTGGTIANTASVTAGETDPDPSNNMDSESTTVTAADLSVSLIDSPDPVDVGQPLTYTIRVINNGPSSTAGVILTDALPSSVSLKSIAPNQGACNGGSVITCNLGALNSGGNANIQIVVTPLLTGMITNTVTVGGAEPDPSLENNAATQTTTVLPVADLSVTVSGFPNPLKIGGVLTYTLVVANNGPSPATTVMLTDTLPLPVNVGPMTSSQGTCTGTNTISCDLGTLNSGSSATVTIVVTPTKLGTITNLAHVTANELDLNPANNVYVNTTPVRTDVYLPVVRK